MNQDIRSQGLRMAEDNPAQFEKRVNGLIARLDGAIKYTPILLDHWEWTDDKIIEFAQKWHDVAMSRLAKAKNPKGKTLIGKFGDDWNSGIPYCRNDIEKTYGRGA